MLEAEEVGELADEIVFVVGELAVGVDHAPHGPDDLDPLLQREVLADEARQGEVVDGFRADVAGGVDEVVCPSLVEVEGTLQVADEIAPLGGGELAVRIGDVEQNGGGGEAELVVPRLLRLLIAEAVTKAIQELIETHRSSLTISCFLLHPSYFPVMPRTDINNLPDDARIWIFGISPPLD